MLFCRWGRTAEWHPCICMHALVCYSAALSTVNIQQSWLIQDEATSLVVHCHGRTALALDLKEICEVSLKR